MMPFREFWPLYLRAHRRRATRQVHYLATVFGASMAVVAVIVSEAVVFVIGIGGAYGMAVGAHWVFEGNQPLIRVNPLWGAIADLRMCWLALTGGLAAEQRRCGIGADGGLLAMSGSAENVVIAQPL
jgi:hypothetical protein